MTRTEKHPHWQRHLADWQRSGLSQQAYCVEHNLKLASFGYWRGRLKSTAELPARMASPHFLALGHTRRLAGSGTVGLTLSDGIRLDIPAALVETLLPPLLQLAREAR